MNKEINNMLMMTAVMMAGIDNSSYKRKDLSEYEIENEILESKERYKQNLLKKGCQEFTIMGITVISRNYKNALRKAKKIIMKTFKEVYKPPFYYDKHGQQVFDEEGLVLDIRSWGRLTGTGALNLPELEAAKIQDAFGNHIAELLNQSFNKI